MSKNEHAAELGRRSAKVRFKGWSKKKISEYMRDLRRQGMAENPPVDNHLNERS